MKNYIIGSGGFSKEVYSIVVNNGICCDGFISLKKTEIRIGSKTFYSILEEDFLNSKEYNNCNLYIGIGSPIVIKTVEEKYKNYNFPNLFDNNCDILGCVELGRGNIFCSGVVLTTNIKIDSFNIFNLNSTVGHDCEIGSFNVFNPTCCISGGVKIGNSNLFGVNSTVLENLKINSKNIIGAMSLVTKNIEEDGNTYIGIPAKRK